jgi:hypothetical protein
MRCGSTLLSRILGVWYRYCKQSARWLQCDSLAYTGYLFSSLIAARGIAGIFEDEERFRLVCQISLLVGLGASAEGVARSLGVGGAELKPEIDAINTVAVQAGWLAPFDLEKGWMLSRI